MKRNNKLIRIGTYLIIIGMIGLILPFITFTNRSEFRDQLKFLPKDESPILSYDGINYLAIEKANINMPLFFGNSESLLEKGGWVYSNSSTPDKGGNTVIFGHRFKYLPPMSNTMFNLDKLAVGDKFEVFWEGKVYKYQVFEVKIIEPTDLSVLNDSKFPMLTLITCTPKFSTKQRLAVKAFLVTE